MKKIVYFLKVFSFMAFLMFSLAVTMNAQHHENDGTPLQSHNDLVNFTADRSSININLKNVADKKNASYLKQRTSSFCGGDGTSAATAYQICDTAQLAYLAYMVNSNQAPNRYAGYYFKLMNNLDLTGWGGEAGWIPIGNDVGTSFLGNFDGNGHTISNLYINRTETSIYIENFGLFGVTGNQQYSPTISNLGVINVNIYSQEQAYTGGLVGQALSSIITNCHATGKVNGYYSGGLIGYTYLSTISNCFSNSYVIARGNICGGGGLIGQNGTTRYPGSSVTNCYSYSTVTSESRGGGLIGYTRNATTDKCYSMGTVTTSGNEGDAGGLIGYSATLSNSVAITSAVNGAGYSGRVASYVAAATNCYAYDGMTITGTCDGCMQGTDATMVTLQTQDLYATTLSWNFTPNTGIWNINTGKSHPYFQWQSAPAYNFSATTSSIIFELRNNADSVVVYKNDLRHKTFINLTAGVKNLAYTSNVGDALSIVVYEHGKIVSYPVQASIDPVITATTGNGGTINPSGFVVVTYGSNMTFTFTPDVTYRIQQVLIDGVNNADAVNNGTYTFPNVISNHSIVVTFERASFTITASATTGGIITPSGNVSVTYGANRAFAFTPNLGYELKDVLVDGNNVPEAVTAGSYTFNNVTANHTIQAVFEKIQFMITAEAENNGTITPFGEISVNYGENQTFAITANAGYVIDQVLVDGVNILATVNNSTYTFVNVRAPHTISATFKQAQYSITATAGAGGYITPSGVVGAAHGDSKTFFIVPNAGYKITQVLVDGIVNTQAMSGSYTFYDISANHTISATFEYSYSTITATAGEGGTIAPAGTIQVLYGQSQYYTITPHFGYKITTVLVDGANNAVSVENGSYLFTNVITDHSIAATFERIPHTIVSEATLGGSISPNGETQVADGGNQAYTITVNEGYILTKVLIDGQNNETAVTAKTYTFSNVAANHTIKAVFEVNKYTIEATAGEGGQISSTGTANVNYGGSKTYTFTPNAGYVIDQVLVDGVNNTTAVTTGTYGFENVKENHTIAVSFKITTLKINATVEGSNGTITPSGETTIDYGTSQTFAFTPNEGYNIAEVLIDGISKPDAVQNGSYTFNNVITDHEIVVKFEKQTFIITASVSSIGGTITPNGKVTVNYGENQTYTIAPNEGYEIADVLVGSVSVGKVEAYTFEKVTANHTIVAAFQVKTAINEVETAKLTVYPNPTSGEVKIKNEELKIKNVLVFDITGRLILEINNVDNNEASIDLSGYANGIYFIRVDGQTVKMVKK